MNRVIFSSSFFFSHVYLFIFVRMLKINCLSKFQLYNTVLLTIVSTLYVSSQEFVHNIITLLVSGVDADKPS